MRTISILTLVLLLGVTACGSDDDPASNGTGGTGGATGGASGAGGSSGTGTGGATGGSAGTTSETLSHHGATQVGSFSPWVMDLNDRSEIAVRFTPTTYPSTLTKVRLWVYNPTAGEDLPFDVRGYGDDGTLPTDTILFTAAPQPVAKDQVDGFLEIDVPDTEIKSGAVWVAVEWKPPPLALDQGAGSFYTTTDDTLDHPDDHVGWTTKWTTFTEAKLPVGDVFIEAIVEH
ncbi:MAG: hypothetical protein IPI67_37535 [Myxococcales bacterium]|nr:hypothetical protein [Myxococcales bacterium]